MACRPSFALIAPLLLAACAVAEPNPPSLAHRDIEGILDQPMRAVAPVASQSDPALASRIEALVAQAEDGQRNFAAGLSTTRDAVARARGAPAESDAWIAAQLALSALDGSRSPTATAMGELDAILAQQTMDGTPVETAPLMAARDHVSTLTADQSQTFEALAAQLRGS